MALPSLISHPTIAADAIIAKGLKPTRDSVEDGEGNSGANSEEGQPNEASWLEYGFIGLHDSLHSLECGDITFTRNRCPDAPRS